jgi:hypothetical protein
VANHPATRLLLGGDAPPEQVEQGHALTAIDNVVAGVGTKGQEPFTCKIHTEALPHLALGKALGDDLLDRLAQPFSESGPQR